MDLWRFIKVLRPSQLWKLLRLSLRFPNFVIPTLIATKKSVQIATAYYGNSHKRNNPANAFRHALWNFLIAKRCRKWALKGKNVLVWTKKITDLHEDLMPNPTLAKAMDLHNNAVGRELASIARITLAEALEELVKMEKKSKKIDRIGLLAHTEKTQLVHIIDFK